MAHSFPTIRRRDAASSCSRTQGRQRLPCTPSRAACLAGWTCGACSHRGKRGILGPRSACVMPPVLSFNHTRSRSNTDSLHPCTITYTATPMAAVAIVCTSAPTHPHPLSHTHTHTPNPALTCVLCSFPGLQGHRETVSKRGRRRTQEQRRTSDSFWCVSCALGFGGIYAFVPQCQDSTAPLVRGSVLFALGYWWHPLVVVRTFPRCWGRECHVGASCNADYAPMPGACIWLFPLDTATYEKGFRGAHPRTANVPLFIPGHSAGSWLLWEFLKLLDAQGTHPSPHAISPMKPTLHAHMATRDTCDCG